MDQQTQQASSGNSDVEKNKTMAIIGYIFPFLFFIPLVNEVSKKSVFAKFHAGQQLNLFLLWVGGWIILGLMSIVLGITIILAPLLPILWLAFGGFAIVLTVMGIINASKGETKPLPVIGGIKLI